MRQTNSGKALIDAYAEWLNTFKWDWFATLTFRGYPSRSRSDRCFHTWIETLEKTLGRTDFRWAKVRENGDGGLHFHLLVGGLKDDLVAERWEVLWMQIAGDAVIETFDPSRNGIRYLLKSIREPREFEFDAKLPQAKDAR